MSKKKVVATQNLSATLVAQAAKDGGVVAALFVSHASALLDVFKVAMRSFKKVTKDAAKLKLMRAEYTMAMQANAAFKKLYKDDASARVQISKAWKKAERREDEDSPTPKYDATRSVNSVFNKLSWPEWAAFVAAVSAKDKETK